MEDPKEDLMEDPKEDRKTLIGPGSWLTITECEDGILTAFCRTGMTEINFDFNTNQMPGSVSQLKTQCQQLKADHDQIVRKSMDDKWDILGYSGVMFLDWLQSCQTLILSDQEIGIRIYQTYIAGIDMIKRQFGM